jgi:hypothetical protein
MIIIYSTQRRGGIVFTLETSLSLSLSLNIRIVSLPAWFGFGFARGSEAALVTLPSGAGADRT